MTIAKAYKMLWVVAALLAAVAFPSFALWLAIVSGVAMLDLFGLIWKTRKVGRPG